MERNSGKEAIACYIGASRGFHEGWHEMKDRIYGHLVRTNPRRTKRLLDHFDNVNKTVGSLKSRKMNIAGNKICISMLFGRN